MKQKILSSFLPLILMVFLLTSSHVTARVLSTKEGGELNNDFSVTEESSLLNMETADSLDKLMGMEECENGDEECFNRRILAEAHLDYIYTQHHKGP